MTSEGTPSLRTIVVAEVRTQDPGNVARPESRIIHSDRFLEGEPKALGVVQVVGGTVQIGVGVPLTLAVSSVSVSLGSFFVLGAAFIASGIISIATERNPRIRMLRVCVSLNVLSCLLAGTGLVIHTLDLLGLPDCEGDDCLELGPLHETSYYTFLALLVFTLLELTVSVVSIAFGCRSMGCGTPYSSMPAMLLDSPSADE